MGIRPDKTTCKIKRRHKHKRGETPLKGFAIDITIRFNTDGHPFLDDHNGNGVMPFNSVDEVAEFVADEIRRNHADHFGTSK